MSTADRFFSEEFPNPQSEKFYSREGFILSISPSKCQVITPLINQANCRI